MIDKILVENYAVTIDDETHFFQSKESAEALLNNHRYLCKKCYKPHKTENRYNWRCKHCKTVNILKFYNRNK